MARDDIWKSLVQAATSGKAVEVVLSPGAELKQPRRSRGRPRVRGIIKFAHYAGYREGIARPRCGARGCRRELRRDQKVACCPEHEAQLVREAERVLSALKEATGA